MASPIDELYWELRMRSGKLAADIKRGAQQSSAGARTAGAQAGKAYGSEFEKRLVETASRAPEKVVPRLRAAFERNMGQIRRALSRGIIDEREFDRSSKEAADAFRRNMVKATEVLERRGLLSPRIQRDFNREMEKLGDRGGNTLADRVKRGLTGGLSGLRGLLAATIAGAVVFAGVQAVQAAARVARRIAEVLRAGIERGSQVQQRRQAFSSLAGGAGIDQAELLRVLRRETRLLVADFDLLRQANFALQAGLPATAEDLGELANIARRTARAVGRDATDAYDRLINSIAKGERRVLDELGIIVSFDDAHRKFAASIGKTSDELDAQEQIQARLTAVLESGRQKIEQLGTETLTAAERLTQLETVIGDIRDRTLELLVQSPSVVQFFEQIGIFAEETGDRIDELAVKVGAFTLAATESLKDVVDLLKLVNRPFAFGARLAEVEDFSERRARHEAELNEVLKREREIDAVRRESNRVALQDRLDELALQERQLRMEREIADERRAGERRRLERAAESNIAAGAPDAANIRIRERLAELDEEDAAIARDRASATDELRQVEAERAEVQGRMNRLTAEGRRELEEVRETTEDAADAAEGFTISLETVNSELGGVQRASIDAKKAMEQFARDSDVELVTEALRGPEMNLEKIAEGLKTNIELLEEFGQTGDEATDDVLDAVADTARGVLDFATALGVLDRDAAAAVGSLLNVASGIESINDALADPDATFASFVPGITGILGGAAALAQGLFGEGPADKAQKELVSAMNRLRESVNRMGDLFSHTTGAVTTALERLAAAPFGPDSPLANEDLILDFGGLDPDRLRAELARLGLTISDLEEFAARANIPIDHLIGALDGTSRDLPLAASQFKALQEAIRIAAEAARTFAEQMSLLRLEFELFDVDDPAERFRRIAQEAIEEGFTETGKLSAVRFAGFGNLDLIDPADVEKARAIIQAAFRDVEAVDRGEIPASAVFGDLSRPEFLDLLRDANALLEQIQQDTETTAGAAGGPGAAGFQVFKGVTDITGNRVAGLLTTIAYWTEQTARGVHGEGANLPPPNTGLFGPFLPPAPTPEETGAATGTGSPKVNIYHAPNVGGVKVTGSGLTTNDVSAAVDTALDRARETFTAETVRALDREFGIRKRRSTRATHGKL